MKVRTGSEYFVHIIIIVLLVIIIAMLLMQGQKKESFDMEHFYEGGNGATCNPNASGGTASNGVCSKGFQCDLNTKKCKRN